MTLLCAAEGFGVDVSAAVGCTSPQKSYRRLRTPWMALHPRIACGARHAAACSSDSTGRYDPMTETKYVVIATEEDGSQSAWGPLSGHRADQAIAALNETGIEHAFALVLRSSAALTAEVPDWTRMVA